MSAGMRREKVSEAGDENSGLDHRNSFIDRENSAVDDRNSAMTVKPRQSY